ncbi:hypothetical protein HA402_009812 [Bradysia odoriphaga]|nr:hypothetical protein HA402_009812 [Bradysia odoriphaga]
MYIISTTVCRQFSTTFFNRKWIYRYLLTLFILMYAINSSPILLTSAQTLKSNRTSAAITQNLQRTVRNNRNNNIRKEHFNSNPDGEISERPSCHSCSQLKDVEADNLRSFKSHILHRLRFDHAPNISMESVTTVSESVLANFYNKYGERYIRRNGRNHDYMDEMMSDEPKNYERDENTVGEDNDSEDEDEPFFSSTQSIYSFPNVSKARHRGDILEFTIHHSSNLAISEAIFHLHIHGDDWITENIPSLLEEHRHDSIGISLNRLVRSTLQRYTRTDSDYRGPVPKGDGFDVQFNVTDMVIDWIKNPQTPQEIVIKTTKQWMRQIIMLDSNSKNAPYIEIQTKEIRRKRTKRQLDCAHAGGETRCCRYPLRVDFRQFGWDWVIAPDVYDAYYCAGDCPQGYLPRYHHSYVSQLGSSFSPCCSPKKLSSLSLLYYDSNKQVIHSIIPNMAVDKCSCS